MVNPFWTVSASRTRSRSRSLSMAYANNAASLVRVLLSVSDSKSDSQSKSSAVERKGCGLSTCRTRTRTRTGPRLQHKRMLNLQNFHVVVVIVAFLRHLHMLLFPAICVLCKIEKFVFHHFFKSSQRVVENVGRVELGKKTQIFHLICIFFSCSLLVFDSTKSIIFNFRFENM